MYVHIYSVDIYLLCVIKALSSIKVIRTVHNICMYIYIVLILYLLCMIKVRVRWCTCSL